MSKLFKLKIFTGAHCIIWWEPKDKIIVNYQHKIINPLRAGFKIRPQIRVEDLLAALDAQLHKITYITTASMSGIAYTLRPLEARHCPAPRGTQGQLHQRKV